MKGKASKIKSKAPSTSKLVKDLDKVYSLAIRHRSAIGGMVSCFTCEKKAPPKEMQLGHYVSRSIKILRWDENNTRVQCVGCNIFKNGNVITFREYLVAELGEVKVKKLEQSRFKLFKPDRSWYLERIEHYKSLLTKE